MCVWEPGGDRVAVVQLNAELRHAQMELLIAHCATERLRNHFSIADIARLGEPNVLKKATRIATDMSSYFNNIKKYLAGDGSQAMEVSDEQVRSGIETFSQFMRERRAHYLPLGRSLSTREVAAMAPFFPADLLQTVRVIENAQPRLEDPECFKKARDFGLKNLPDLSHITSMTLDDVIVFNETIAERTLFHALVHAMQMQVLGLDWYSDLFVHAFIRVGAHFRVPLESQAFLLESRFATDPNQPFSVADIVREHALHRRYE